VRSLPRRSYAYQPPDDDDEPQAKIPVPPSDDNGHFTTDDEAEESTDHQFSDEDETQNSSAGASSEDVFSAEEEVIAGTKKRSVKVGQPVKKGWAKKVHVNKDVRIPGDDEDQENNNAPILSGGATPKQSLSTLRLNTLKSTSFLKRWTDVRSKLEVIKHVRPSPIETLVLTPLGDMPDMLLRDFKLDVNSGVLDINWDSAKDEELKTSAWRLWWIPKCDDEVFEEDQDMTNLCVE
jgi:hypothetical protein